MEKPNIYTLHSAPVIGVIVHPSKIKEDIRCNICHIKDFPLRYTDIHYEIDYWNNEAMILGESVFMVNSQLKEAIEKNGIKGCAFEKVKLVKRPYFEEINKKDIEKTLPNFWALVILKRCKGPEIWWKRVPCKDCDKEKWDITEAGIISISIPFNTDPVPMRTVFYNSWKGEDIFYLEDPDSPIITEKMATILRQFNEDINLLDSGWE